MPSRPLRRSAGCAADHRAAAPEASHALDRDLRPPAVSRGLPTSRRRAASPLRPWPHWVHHAVRAGLLDAERCCGRSGTDGAAGRRSDIVARRYRLQALPVACHRRRAADASDDSGLSASRRRLAGDPIYTGTTAADLHWPGTAGTG